jgi:hypothetical protein
MFKINIVRHINSILSSIVSSLKYLCSVISFLYENAKKVASLFQEIAQLPEDKQAEIVEAVVAMRCAHLGIYPTDDVEAARITD